MRTRLTFRALSLLLLACLCCAKAAAQEVPNAPQEPKCAAPDAVQWLNCIVYGVAAARINQSGANKQVETPSIADNTTSLVDQTEAPDLFGLALNVAGVNKGDANDSGATSPSVTTNAYALYTAAHTPKQDPLDPAFYNRHAGLRKLSFTLGRDDGKADDDSDDAMILGFKYLIINKREAGSKSNLGHIMAVSDAVKNFSGNFLKLTDEVQRYFLKEFGPSLGYPRAGETDNDALNRFITEQLDKPTEFGNILAKLTPDQKKEIMRLVNNRLDSAVALQSTALEEFEKIRRRPQLSFSFQTKQRREKGSDEYRTGLLFDFGVARQFNLAANATFDYEDSKVVGGDKRGGRLAVESYFHLNRPNNIFTGKDPIKLSFTGEGKWMSAAKPTYVGQVKLTLPLFDGVTLPFSFSVANRSDLIKESKVRGRFGFTFDMAKLLKGFQK